MPKPFRIRLNLEFDPAVYRRTLVLQRRTNSASLTETIRRALALLDTVTEDLEEGGKLQVVNAAGKIETIKLVC